MILFLLNDPTDSSRKIKKNKLLLQTSVRKLHSDLVADVPECTSSNGKVIVSDTKLRALNPQNWSRWLSGTSRCVVALTVSQLICIIRHIIGKIVVLKVLKQQLHNSARGGSSRRKLVRQVQEYELYCQVKTKVKDTLQQIHCTPKVSPITGVLRGL